MKTPAKKKIRTRRHGTPVLTRRDLAVRVAAQTQFTQLEAAEMIQKVIESIENALAEGNVVEFRDFGVFESVKRTPRIGRNSKRPTETVMIPERTVIKFRAGQKLRARLSKGK